MNYFDVRHPLFLPLWRRIAVVGACFGWAVVEFVSGYPGWALIFVAAGAWCGWNFFVKFDPKDYEPKDRP